MEIKERVEKVCVNSVLLNQYRTGLDSASWPADDEPELGLRPFIASLSLGHERDFQPKPKIHKDLQRLCYSLTHGSLLLMGEGTQEDYLHAVPKRRGLRAEKVRINLTFRRVVLQDEAEAGC